MKVAIIGGGGKMGRWVARFLLQDGCEIFLTDVSREKLAETSLDLGVPAATGNLEAIAGADYIVLAVPIEKVGGVAREIGPHLRRGQSVIDISSIKVKTLRVLHRYIPKNTVLGVHPLFGPGAAGVVNKNIVLTPSRKEESALALKLKDYLEKRGGRVSLMTPREHDRIMSLVLGLSHFISLVTADTLLQTGEMRPLAASGSSTYKVLLTLVESVLSEDPELYGSIQTSLPDIVRYERMFQQKAGEWADIVAAGDRETFVRRVKTMKAKMAQVAPDFEKSYEKMYRLIEGL